MSKRRRCRNVVTVVNVLKEQGVLTIDIQEAFRRGNVDALIFSNKDAVLIKHSCGAYMLWAATVEAGRLALREVAEMQVCVVHGQAAFEAIRCERKGFSVEKPCKQFCRYSMQRHKAKSPFPIRELTTDDLPQVAAHYKLDHLICFVDFNKRQLDGAVDDIMSHGKGIGAKFDAFGWNVIDVADGNDVEQVYDAVQAAYATEGKPTCIVLNTVKGKGCTFAEPSGAHSSQPSKEQWDEAIKFAEEELAKVKAQ